MKSLDKNLIKTLTCVQQVTLLPEVSEKTQNIVMLRMTSLFKIASLTLSQASVNKKEQIIEISSWSQAQD